MPDSFVDALRPHVCRQVRAMVELQPLSGRRPGEVCIIRTCDQDVSGAYKPNSHKTEHHGKSRTVFLGPKAQIILCDWIRAELKADLVSPVEAERERKDALRAARKTRVQPSQTDRAKPTPSDRHGSDTPPSRFTERSWRDAERRTFRTDTRIGFATTPRPGDEGNSTWTPHVRSSGTARPL